MLNWNPSDTKVQADTCSLPFKDDSFDSAIAAFVVNYIKDTQEFVKELKRVLKNNSNLIIVQGKSIHPLHKLAENPNFTINKFIGLLRKNGFTAEEIKMAKDNTVGGLKLSLESSNFIASSLGGMEILEDQILTPEEVIKNTLPSGLFGGQETPVEAQRGWHIAGGRVEDRSKVRSVVVLSGQAVRIKVTLSAPDVILARAQQREVVALRGSGTP